MINPFDAPIDDPTPIDKSQTVLREFLQASATHGIQVAMLITVAPRPMEEIARVAQLHCCESVLLGLSHISEKGDFEQYEFILNAVDASVVVLRSPKKWQVAEAERILIPFAGRGDHDYLLALLLGSLLRSGKRQVTFLRVLPTNGSPGTVRRARRALVNLGADLPCESYHVEALRADDAVAEVVAHATAFDLTILGVRRSDHQKKMIGDFPRQIAQSVSYPLIVISIRG